MTVLILKTRTIKCAILEDFMNHVVRPIAHQNRSRFSQVFLIAFLLSKHYF